MKLTCGNCGQGFSVDEKKITGTTFRVKCPKCGNSITGQKEAPRVADPAEMTQMMTEETAPTVEDLIRKEVAAAKAEILGSLRTLLQNGGKLGEQEHAEQAPAARRALVCEDASQDVETISAVLRKLGYTVEVARTAAESLKKLEAGSYQVITLHMQFPDDKEGGQKILAKINGQKPLLRRQTFVVLVSSTIKSADANAAFFNGANVTVNKEEIQNLESLIREGQKNFEQIYHVFNQVLAEKE